jgi:phage anti-repressor protein
VIAAKAVTREIIIVILLEVDTSKHTLSTKFYHKGTSNKRRKTMSNLIVIENGLIPVYKNNENGQVVNARELHEFLEVGKDFTTWIKDRIDKYDFVEETDFITTPQKRGTANGGYKIVDEYILTLDTAKEIAMVQNNEKGKQVRKYFIAIEKKYKQIVNNPYNALSPELKAIFKIDEKQQKIETRIDNLESNMPLFNVECKDLQSLVRKIGIKALGGYKSPSYNDNSLRGKVYSDIQHQLKREFGVSRYEAIKRCQLGKARKIIEEYKAPTVLVDKIYLTNSQMGM